MTTRTQIATGTPAVPDHPVALWRPELRCR